MLPVIPKIIFLDESLYDDRVGPTKVRDRYKWIVDFEAVFDPIRRIHRPVRLVRRFLGIADREKFIEALRIRLVQESIVKATVHKIFPPWSPEKEKEIDGINQELKAENEKLKKQIQT